MRIFIALDLPANIKRALAEFQKELRGAEADISWTKPENFHLTLKFLGETAPDKIADITKICEEIAAATPPFSLHLHDAGVFPNVRNPRVLWVGIAGATDFVKSLHKILDEKLSALGFAKEPRPFNPHVTLGRVKTMKNVVPATAKLLIHKFPALNFDAKEIVVLQSQLHSQGSIYTPLAKCEFKG